MKLVQIFVSRRTQRFDNMAGACELLCQTYRFCTVVEDKQSSGLLSVLRQGQHIKQQRASACLRGKAAVGLIVLHALSERVIHFGMLLKAEAVGQELSCRRIFIMDFHAAVDCDKAFTQRVQNFLSLQEHPREGVGFVAEERASDRIRNKPREQNAQGQHDREHSREFKDQSLLRRPDGIKGSTDKDETDCLSVCVRNCVKGAPLYVLPAGARRDIGIGAFEDRRFVTTDKMLSDLVRIRMVQPNIRRICDDDIVDGV